MNEIKNNKKPLIFYYLIVLLVVFLFNALAVPYFAEHRIVEVDYGTFVSMTENNEIGRVDVQSNQIVFPDKEETQIYKTGVLYDPNLVERLGASDAVYGSEIVEETSPLLSILLTWILPMLIFVGIGQFL